MYFLGQEAVGGGGRAPQAACAAGLLGAVHSGGRGARAPPRAGAEGARAERQGRPCRVHEP